MDIGQAIETGLQNLVWSSIILVIVIAIGLFIATLRK